MALWGSRDSFSITGTVSFVNGSATVSGSGTSFGTELEVGDAIVTAAGVKYKVVGIAGNASITIDPAWSTANASSQTITGQDVTKFMNITNNGHYQSQRNVYGVDSTEAVAETTDPGWIHVNEYTDMHGNPRKKNEVLVAMSSITGDAEDVVFPDTVITIRTQPANSTANADLAVSFTVVATTLPAGTTVNYRWQRAANANVAFSNLSDAGTYSNTATATLNVANNSVAESGSIYRVQLSAAGVTANTVSANAILTINA